MKERSSGNEIHEACRLESSSSCVTKLRQRGFWQTIVPRCKSGEELYQMTVNIGLGLHEANVLVCCCVAGDDSPRGCTFPSEVVPSLSPETSELVAFEWSMEDVRTESCISIQLFSLSVSCLMFYFQLGVLRTLYLCYKMHLSSGYEVLKMPVSDISF